MWPAKLLRASGRSWWGLNSSCLWNNDATLRGGAERAAIQHPPRASALGLHLNARAARGVREEFAGPSCHHPSSWRHLELGEEGACPISWLSCATGRKTELSWTLVPSLKRPHEHGQALDSHHQGVRRLAGGTTGAVGRQDRGISCPHRTPGHQRRISSTLLVFSAENLHMVIVKSCSHRRKLQPPADSNSW